MAYYDNAPSHKPQGKKSFGREKWVEEGSEYRILIRLPLLPTVQKHWMNW